MLRDGAEFGGLYNLVIHMKDGKVFTHKRVFVDNEQYNLGNIRVTNEQNESVLYAKSDVKKWSFDSKDCQRW